jgi:geranylgeranyl pyrophosphate synthase
MADSDVTVAEQLEAAREVVDAELAEWGDRLAAEHHGRLGEALRYALRSPGKRVRPALVIAAYHAAGGTHPAISGVATAVEIVHTYSLVHDDLPCMDDDGLRRGRATTHVKFDPDTAARVGFLLVPVAAEALAIAAANLGLSAPEASSLAVELFEAGGIRGMVGGQWLDLEAEGRHPDLAELTVIHRCKTGALISAAVVLGCLAARGDPKMLAAFREYGDEVGLAFQVADDVLDATGTSETLGKTAGKDAEVAKSTYVGILGIEGAREEAVRHQERAIAALVGAGVAPASLAPLARYIVTRSS